MAGIELCSHSSPIISATRCTEQYLTRSSIVEVPAILASLVNLEDFQSRTIRIVVGHMDGIAVSEACAIEQTSVIVKRCRSPDDLITAVAVDIGYRHIVVAVLWLSHF